MAKEKSPDEQQYPSRPEHGAALDNQHVNTSATKDDIKSVIERPSLDDETSEKLDTLFRNIAREDLGAICEQLESGGVNPNLIQDKGQYIGRIPLHFAARNKISPEMVSLLLEHGADVDIRDSGGKTTLMVVLTAGGNGDQENLQKIADMLLQHGANVNAEDSAGNTPMMFASTTHGHFSLFNKLLEQEEVDIHKRNNNEKGSNALMVASKHPHLEVTWGNEITEEQKAIGTKKVEALLEKGADADVNVQNEKGQTPVMLAAYYGLDSYISLLQDHGADLSIKDENGISAEQYIKDTSLRHKPQVIQQHLLPGNE